MTAEPDPGGCYRVEVRDAATRRVLGRPIVSAASAEEATERALALLAPRIGESPVEATPTWLHPPSYHVPRGRPSRAAVREQLVRARLTRWLGRRRPG